MESLLDSVIAETERARGGAVIVSEEHDTGKVTVEESAITSALRGGAGVWDASEYGISAVEVAKRLERAITKRENLLADLCERYDSERCGIGGMRGTGWAAWNAVTEAVDHGTLGGRTTGEDKASRKFESVLTGGGDEVKQVAFEMVKQLAS